jgi:DHA1 family tetracycline resistance protein-like MFS transporter
VGLIAPLTKRYRENVLIITGLWIMGLSLLGWAFTRDLIPLLIVLLPMSLSGGVLNTVIQSSISKSVSREEVGGMLGIASSLEAFTRVIGPTIGGLLLERLGVWAPGVFSAVLMAWVVLFTYRKVILPSKKERLAQMA